MSSGPERRFVFRLALHLGYPHPDYLMPMLTASQINDWIEFDRVEGFGEHRAELRNGLLCSLLANINSDSKTRERAFVPDDFMFFSGPQKPEKQLSHEELERQLDKLLGC